MISTIDLITERPESYVMCALSISRFSFSIQDLRIRPIDGKWLVLVSNFEMHSGFKLGFKLEKLSNLLRYKSSCTQQSFALQENVQ